LLEEMATAATRGFDQKNRGYGYAPALFHLQHSRCEITTEDKGEDIFFKSQISLAETC